MNPTATAPITTSYYYYYYYYYRYRFHYHYHESLQKTVANCNVRGPIATHRARLKIKCEVEDSVRCLLSRR